MSLERALWMLQALAGEDSFCMNVVKWSDGIDIEITTGSHEFTTTGRDLDEATAAAISELEQRIDLVSQLEANGAPITNEKETTWPQQ